MHDTDNDAMFLQIQREELADHVQGRFRGVVRVVAAAFFGVAEGDGPGFGGDEEDFGTRGEEVRAVEGVDYEWGCDG